MNRIERLLWEEANIKDISKRKPRARSFGRALSIALLLGIFASIAVRPWPPSYPDARVNAAAAKTAAAQHASAAGATTRPAATTKRGVHVAPQERSAGEEDEAER